MKTDLASAIVAAVLGFAIAFFATNFLIPQIEDVSFSTLDSSVNSDLVEPNVEVFNYKALNPTVEVYVGQCRTFNSNGECIDDVVNTQPEESTEEESTENSTNENETENNEENAVTPDNSIPTEPTEEPNTNTESN